MRRVPLPPLLPPNLLKMIHGVIVRRRGFLKTSERSALLLSLSLFYYKTRTEHREMFQPGFKKIHIFSRQQSLGKKRHFLFFMLGYDFGEMFSRRLKTFLIPFSFLFSFQKGKSYIYDLLKSVSSAAIKRRRSEVYKAKMKRKEKRRSCLFGLRFIDHPRCELKNSGLLYASFQFYFLPLFSFLKKKKKLSAPSCVPVACVGSGVAPGGTKG